MVAWKESTRRRHFWALVNRLSDDECWQWLGTINPKGYGRFADDYAHRMSYEFERGPIAADMTIDHLCRNRACINPAHFEVVTRGENTLRGETGPGINMRKTRCKRGHELIGENLGVSADGQHRYCKPCRIIHKLNASRRKAGLPTVSVDDVARGFDLIGNERAKHHILTPPKTHCPSGHPYKGKNLIVQSDGSRKCRTCHNERRRNT